MIAGANLRGRFKVGRLPVPHKGMAQVWPAHDTSLDRQVIVKILVAADLDAVRRFHREARLTCRLDHPGVPAVFDLGTHDGAPYVVLQQIDGITLSDLVSEQGPLPVPWVAAIGAQISSVLLAADQIGLVHRDIKPSNIMLDKSGAVKVLDFGLAAMHDDDRYPRITQTGESLGTIGYMAPEQVRGEDVDHRTDLYGLGATLYDLLTDRPPFGDATTTTVLRNQMDMSPPRPAAARPDIPVELDDLVHSLLAVDREARPPNAADAYAVLAPLARDLTPIPRVVEDRNDAVRAYAAIVGRVPRPARPVVAAAAGSGEFDVRRTEQEAQAAYDAGRFRAAARAWREIAKHQVRQHGEENPLAFHCLRRAALANAELGERARALRLLEALLAKRTAVDGPRHPEVLRLRQDIADVTSAPGTGAGR